MPILPEKDLHINLHRMKDVKTVCTIITSYNISSTNSLPWQGNTKANKTDCYDFGILNVKVINDSINAVHANC